MKKKIKLLAIAIITIISIIILPKQTSAQEMEVSYQVFYDELSPYGQWVNFSNYGYVWMPDSEPDFAPYSSNGYWVMTDYGMTWVSNYRWGWAPFHYGRWNFDDSYGWFWIPDNVWGPAWVTWRSSNGYYGWAPMQPGISVNISFGNNYTSNYNQWVFVRCNDIDRHDVHRYYVNHHHNNHRDIIRNSTVINNTYVDNDRRSTYVSGPRNIDIHRNIGRNVRTVSVHENNAPGQDLRNDQLNIYRPRIVNNNERNGRIAPTRTTNINDVNRRGKNNSTNQNQSTSNERVQQNYSNKTDEIKRKQEVNNNQTNNANRNQQVNKNNTEMNKRVQQNYTNRTNDIKQKQVNERQQNTNKNTNMGTNNGNGKGNRQSTTNTSKNTRTENQKSNKTEQNKRNR